MANARTICALIFSGAAVACGSASSTDNGLPPEPIRFTVQVSEAADSHHCAASQTTERYKSINPLGVWWYNSSLWCFKPNGAGRITAWRETDVKSATAELGLSKSTAYLNPPRSPAFDRQKGLLEGNKCDISDRLQLFIGSNKLNGSQSPPGCENFEFRGIYVSSNESDYGIPVLRFKNEKEAPRNIIVYLSGGPFGGVSTNIDKDYILRDIIHSYSNSSEIIVPQYFGLDRMTSVGNAGIDVAINEVNFLVEKASSQYANVCLIGASLGGYILAAAKVDSQNVHRLMVSPMIISPSELYERQLVEFAQRDKIEGEQKFERFEVLGDGNLRLRYEKVGSEKLVHSNAYKAYFGGYWNKRLASLLRNRVNKTSVVVDITDRQIGGELAAQLQGVILKASGEFENHLYFSQMNYPSYSRHIHEFTKGCLDNRGRS